MGPGQNNFAAPTALLIFVIGWVTAQDYYEERHKYQMKSHMGQLNEIPKHFEVKDENAVSVFNKYLADIHNLAFKNNLSVVYRVKVDTLIKNKHKNPTKQMVNKGKSKKYNVPLKKKNMKMSSFEMILRNRANDIGNKQHNYEDVTTTERQRIILTTKPPYAGKYKPIISGVKTNFAKIIRPVRNKIITLDS